MKYIEDAKSESDPSKSHSRVEVNGCFFPVIFIILHFSVLHPSRFTRSCWNNSRSPAEAMVLEHLQSSAYSAMVLPGSDTLVRSLINIVKNTGPNKEP